MFYERVADVNDRGASDGLLLAAAGTKKCIRIVNRVPGGSGSPSAGLFVRRIERHNPVIGCFNRQRRAF
jgi:hypothetical protein